MTVTCVPGEWALSKDEILDYVLKLEELEPADEGELLRVEEHLCECSICRERLAASMADLAVVRASAQRVDSDPDVKIDGPSAGAVGGLRLTPRDESAPGEGRRTWRPGWLQVCAAASMAMLAGGSVVAAVMARSELRSLRDREKGYLSALEKVPAMKRELQELRDAVARLSEPVAAYAGSQELRDASDAGGAQPGDKFAARELRAPPPSSRPGAATGEQPAVANRGEAPEELKSAAAVLVQFEPEQRIVVELQRTPREGGERESVAKVSLSRDGLKHNRAARELIAAAIRNKALTEPTPVRAVRGECNRSITATEFDRLLNSVQSDGHVSWSLERVPDSLWEKVRNLRDHS